MMTVFDEIIVSYSISSPILILIVIFAVLCNKLDRVGPTRKEAVIMFCIVLLALLLSTVSIILWGEEIQERLYPLISGSTMFFVIAFYSSIIITALGTKRRVVTTSVPLDKVEQETESG